MKYDIQYKKEYLKINKQPNLLNRHKIVLDYLSHFRNKTVLEIGCAQGILLNKIKAEEVVGADIFLRKNKNLAKNVKYFKIDLRKPVTHKTQYDILIFLEVIEHIENFNLTMTNLKKLIKPNGLLIISTINFSWILYRILMLLGMAPTRLGKIDKKRFFFFRTGIETEKHINHYNYRRLKTLLEYYNFRIIKNLSFCNFPYQYSKRFIKTPIWSNLFSNRILFVAKKE